MENTVVNIKVSEEKAHSIEETIRNKIFEAELTANRCYVDVALKVTEAIEQKVHVLRGFDDDMKGAEKYLKATFGIGGTQRKSYAIVTHKYARRIKDSTEYQLIDDSLRDYGVANLEEIQKIEGFTNESKEALVKFLADNSITSKTSKSDIQKIRGIEDKAQKTGDNKTEGQKTDNKAEGQKTDSTQPVNNDNVTTQLKAENDALHVKVDDTKELFTKLYQLALDKKVNDKDYRTQSIEILKQLEKKYR